MKRSCTDCFIGCDLPLFYKSFKTGIINHSKGDMGLEDHGGGDGKEREGEDGEGDRKGRAAVDRSLSFPAAK